MSTVVCKIIVDSRAFLDNAPAQSGTFELPEIIELYGNEALYLQSFHCVASWLSVDATNDTMYMIENGVTTVARAVKLPHAASRRSSRRHSTALVRSRRGPSTAPSPVASATTTEPETPGCRSAARRAG